MPIEAYNQEIKLTSIDRFHASHRYGYCHQMILRTASYLERLNTKKVGAVLAAKPLPLVLNRFSLNVTLLDWRLFLPAFHRAVRNNLCPAKLRKALTVTLLLLP